MRKKALILVMMCVMAVSVCACADKKDEPKTTDVVNTATEKSDTEVNSGEQKASVGDLADETETKSGDLADNPGEVSDKIFEGEFVGWMDGHTVEVKVNGNPTAYIVLDEKVMEVLNAFDGGTVFTFEVETEGEMRKIINVIGE